MKKILLAGLITTVNIGLFFYAVHSTNNYAKKLIGTWESQTSGITYIFNKDGTGVSGGSEHGNRNGFIYWGVSTSGRLWIYHGDIHNNDSTFYLSPDGKRMIFYGDVYLKRATLIGKQGGKV